MTKYNSILIVTFCIFFAACGQPPTSNTRSDSGNASTPAVPASPSPAIEVDLMAQGRNIYMSNCVACHKEDGSGGKMTIEGKTIDPDDLTASKIKAMTDDKIYGYIHRGIPDEGMPAFKDKLSEAEIREVVRYIRAEIQDMPAATPAR